MSPNTIERYEHSLMNTYGPPRRVLVRGDGCYVWDEDGRCYLDLLGGLAVNVLGHGHPALVAAVTEQLRTLGQVSNFFATPLQVALAERLLEVSCADGGRVFFVNSGTEALEAAFKMARRTGRSTIVAATGGFHGRTMGSLALAGKPAIREPFAPLPGGVVHVPYADVDALAAAVGADTAAVVLEPIQGEAGVRVPPAGYLRAARQITRRHGALLVLDEVQTGVGRTGEWFAFQHDGVRPDIVTVAKGLGGGFPIGACLGFGPAADLLGPGSHGSTFGGNPVAAAAGLAVLETVERDGLLDNVNKVGDQLRRGVESLGDPLVAGVRGRGLLLAIELTTPVATQAAAAALDAGFIVNPVSSDALRLAPPLVLSGDQVESFVGALPSILDTIREA
ncbi:MAG TPA: acetylornithine transaminase [Jiangellaceae bacterium]|nr:acetylornithine transaminase [Jiangellaceae bacterium]